MKALVSLTLILSAHNAFAYVTLHDRDVYLTSIVSTLSTSRNAVLCGNRGNNTESLGGDINDSLRKVLKSVKAKVVSSTGTSDTELCLVLEKI